MRIGIDARLFHFAQAGISYYTIRLIRALLAVDKSNDYVVIQDRRDRKVIVDEPRATRLGTRTPAHSRFERLTLPWELLRAKLDLLHSTDFVAPRLRRTWSVVTIHDLAFLLHPEFVTEASRRYYGKVRDTVRRADALIAVSERTKRDIVRLLGVPPENVTVIHHAADAAYVQINDSEALTRFRDTRELPDRFILFVGTLEPRKNLKGLLDGYALARDGGLDQPLLIVGRQGWLMDDLDQQVARLNLTPHVRFYGPAEERDLVYLYNLASALVLPSFYEGFGFPILEAMACGTPVISSDAACLPEIVGDAGLLFPPTDTESLARHLLAVTEDDESAKRLQRAGLARAAEFSWDRTALQTLAIYESVGAR